MAENVWIRPLARDLAEPENDVTRCAICGVTVTDEGVIVEVLAENGKNVCRTLCQHDMANPVEIADLIHYMRHGAT